MCFYGRHNIYLINYTAEYVSMFIAGREYWHYNKTEQNCTKTHTCWCCPYTTLPDGKMLSKNRQNLIFTRIPCIWHPIATSHPQIKYPHNLMSLAFNIITVLTNIICKIARTNVSYSFNKELHRLKIYKVLISSKNVNSCLSNISLTEFRQRFLFQV